MINDRTFQSVPAKLTRTGLAFGLALTFATAAHAQPASAPPAQAANEDAGQRFKRGVELYQDHDFRAAILEFQRAYQIAPNFRVLYNIGQAYFEVQDYVAAEDAFTRYLRDGGGDVPADRVEEVKGLLEKLKARIATLELTANVEGAQISIDDVERGTTPLPGPIRISAGQRKLTITKEGFTSISRSLSMKHQRRNLRRLRQHHLHRPEGARRRAGLHLHHRRRLQQHPGLGRHGLLRRDRPGHLHLVRQRRWRPQHHARTDVDAR